MNISALPLADAVSLGSGDSFDGTAAIGGLPTIHLNDGPNGVRKQAGDSDALGLAPSQPATCFPPLTALAQTWDTDLVRRVGAALGDEAQAADVQVLLGPGINIKRSPLGGRNFEYLSEDPHISGVLGSAWVRGIQSRGVGASVKHYALNNQERDRMRVSADIDPRAMREVYLRAFQRVVQDARPWTVMAAYNRVNGVPVCEDPFLLTQVLREEWGFDGVVVSDWGAVRDRVAAIAAGLDLQMPYDGGIADATAVAAVESGDLDRSAVDRAAERVARLVRTAASHRRENDVVDLDTHHALAREAASRAIVLLQNEGDLLPLAPRGSIAVVGPFAQQPRFQGGGSAHVTPTRVDVPLDAIRAAALEADVSYAPGFTVDGSETSAELISEAASLAGSSDVAIVFLGLADGQESEGFDRESIELPAEQIRLLQAVTSRQPNTVVVLSHGGIVRLAVVTPLVPAILDGNLLGQAGAGAIADVLFGTVTPSGKLTETVPLRFEDTPAFLDFPGEYQHVRYSEGLFVGYRWYDARDIPVSFPFGHGLSYTTFDFARPTVRKHGETASISVSVTNTGTRPGREIVQAYVSVPNSHQVRVPRTLAGFASVELAPGETREVEIVLDRRDLEYWDIRANRFVLEPGTYEIALGSSSQDLRATVRVELDGEELRVPLTLDSTIGELMADPVASALVAQMMPTRDMEQDDNALGVDLQRMMESVPLGHSISMAGGAVSAEQLEQLLAAANAAR
jgi:beta-glucosidase